MDHDAMNAAYQRALQIKSLKEEAEQLLEDGPPADIFAGVPDLISRLEDKHTVAWEPMCLEAALMINLLYGYVTLRDAQMDRLLELSSVLIDVARS